MSYSKDDIKMLLASDEKVRKTLNDPKITRRNFMAIAGALGMSATVGSSLWSNKALANTPQNGGHMRAGLNDTNTADSLDSTQFVNTTMICISRGFRDSLVNVGPDNNLEAALAESWESSADAKTWRFNIRQGVEFSDGKPLTTEDCVNSTLVHMGEESTSAAAGVFAGIESCTAEGNTMVVKLKDANADMPFLLTDYHYSVVPTVDGKADLHSTQGTGAYFLKEYEAGVRTILEKNPNAWEAATAGHADTIEIIGILDDAARQSALISGTVDLINRPALKTISRLEKVPGMNILGAESNLAFTHPMRMDQAPFDNLDFRLALKYSTPRQEFIDKILFGYGVLGNDQPLGPKFNSYNPDLTVEYDMDKAKFHLEKSGLAGANFDLSASDTAYGGAVEAAQLFQSSWNELGVNANIVREPQDGYWNSVWNVKPFCACYWGARPVEDMILSIAYLSDSPWNDTVIKNARVDELVVAARGELDQDKRTAMYHEVQAIISAEGGTIIPAFGQDVAASSDKVGVPSSFGGGWEMDGGHFVKRWWMNA
jgi:peptide/nickel transport system substrate-binding protein